MIVAAETKRHVFPVLRRECHFYLRVSLGRSGGCKKIVSERRSLGARLHASPHLAQVVRRAEPYTNTSEAIMSIGEWEFYRIPGNDADESPFQWVWQCRREDGSVVSATDTFRFLLDCVAHARLHGYLGGPLQTRRDPAYAATPRAPTTTARAAASPG
jgi:hypothetical protein